jgi:ATP-dependent RNA helicase DHX36
MLLWAVMLRCVEPIATIAAALSFKDPFVCPLHKQHAADAAKRRLAAASLSDHCAVYNAVKGWEAAVRSGGGAGDRYVHDNFLSRATLQMLQSMRRQFVDILCSAGFLPPSPAGGAPGAIMLGGSAANENSSQEDVVKAVVAAGLYPNVIAVRKHGGRPSSRPPRLSVRGIGRVELHPKSALAGMTALSQPYMVYHTLVRSSACFVHDATCVPMMALVLFGGKLVAQQAGAGGAVTLTLDGWLTVHVAADSAACVMALTQRMQHCLQAKFTTPALDVYAPSPPLSARVAQSNLPHRYGDSGFAAISRETLQLLRCSFSLARAAAAVTHGSATTEDAGSCSDDDSRATAAHLQPVQGFVTRTFQIGGGGGGSDAMDALNE